MNMEQAIKILIVDDEPFARRYIREMLKGDADVEIVGEAGNGKKAGQMIAEADPDLVFLDVQMPEMDGLSLLESLDPKSLPFIIFTTAYEEYAIKAFEYHALDYLLKPFDQKRFASALEHAKRSIRSGDSASSQIMELISSIKKPKYLERLLIKHNGRIVFVNIKDVDWIKADDKYLQIRHGGTKHMIRQALHALKSQIDPEMFVQVNRSVLVNVERIKELHPMFNGDHEVKMADGATFTLSRGHKNELFGLLGKPIS